MKKNYLFIVLGIALLTMNACKSELDLDKELKFSKLTVEKQKEKIESSGMDMVNIMDGMLDTEAMNAITNMMSISDINLSELQAVKAPMQNLRTDLKNNRLTAFSNFDRQMRISYVESDVWGEYEYNFTTKEIEQIKTLTNKLIVRFPATETSTKNNAEITITYEESNVIVPESEDYYPSKMTFKMNVDSKEVMTANFSGTYYTDGTPKKVSASVTIEDYKWTLEVANDKKTASETYEFKQGSKTIIKSNAEIKGKLSQDELENSEYPQDVISSFAMYFQAMNIAVRGGMTDFNKFAQEMETITKNSTLTEKQAMERTATLVNKYMVFYAFFVDSNEKFADVEFYVVEDEVYDEWAGYYVTEYNLAPRFVLSDGSKVSAEEFIQTGFDDLIQKIEDMTAEFN